MTSRLIAALMCVAAAMCARAAESTNAAPPAPVVTNLLDNLPYPPHDMSRPQPPKVDPKPEAELQAAGRAPQGAVVLFDGTNLDAWQMANNQPMAWFITNGVLQVAPKTASLRTRDSFGSCRLHLEFRTEGPQTKDGQNASNSGIFFMNQYEIQVLDCYTNRTYPDGTVGAIYGQSPPLVNASGPPGTWHYYDIDFTAPKFGPDGEVLRRAKITARLNGHLVQDGFELVGPAGHKKRPPYKPHPPKLPLGLQDHHQPVQFRNIWIVPRED